ncbi:MAG: cohesin domain-containing protein [Candidatus Bathyarchaeia archaeon]
MRCTVTVIVILGIVFLLTSANAQIVTVYIETDRMDVYPSETFSANIIVDPGEKGISAVDIILSFNPEILEALSINKGSLLGKNVIELFNEINNTEGVIRYVAARVGPTIPPTPKEVLITITFRVRQDVEPINTTLIITNIGIADEKNSDIEDIAIGNATISITSTTATTTITVPPITTTTVAMTVTSYFPTPMRSIQMTTITVEGRGIMNLVFLSVMLIIAVSVIVIGVLLVIELKKRRRKPIVIGIK